MNTRVKLACQTEIRLLRLEQILPSRLIEPTIKRTSKYKCIAASVREAGIIEPLVVFPHKNNADSYLLLDGHVRLEILKELGRPEVRCIISTDDESYTYNHKVSRLSAIQEHFMILKAIKSGVTETRIATMLNIDVASIRQKRDLLEGICPEAVQLLREKRANAGGLRELRRVKPMRQIEMAELMCASHNFSASYAKCLVATTPEEQLVDGDRPKEYAGLSSDEIARMEHEMATLGKEFKLIEESHGRNVLNTVIVGGYLRKLLDNARVIRFLGQHYPEIATELQKVAEAKNLNDDSSAA
jgi:hypothetical protein